MNSMTSTSGGRVSRHRGFSTSTTIALALGATLLTGCSVPSVASMSPDLPKHPVAAATEPTAPVEASTGDAATPPATPSASPVTTPAGPPAAADGGDLKLGT